MILALALCACAPKVSTTPDTFDEELGKAEAVPVDPVEAPRPVAPPGKGERSGTIARANLVAILDKGPGMFLRTLEVTPNMLGDRFVGWKLVQFIGQGSPLYDVDLAPGDVLLAINGKPLSRPDQLQSLWDSLRTSNEIVAQLWRGDAKFELTFAIEPKLPPTAK